MTITSFSFFLFVGFSLIFYYLMPKAWQPYLLLISSVVFYMFAAVPWTFLYVAATTVTVYAATLFMAKKRAKAATGSGRAVKAVFILTVILNMGILAVLKYLNFFIDNLSSVLGRFQTGAGLTGVSFIASLGISYYTLQMLGYLTDVYWEVQEPLKNPFKVALFNCFFPQMISGPISRFSELSDSLFSRHEFSFDRLCRGAERVLWGLFKKLIVSERMALVINGIYASPLTYYGGYVWIAVLTYPIQIYCDFSGCMDIVIGVAECFGIKLPENFRTPFFSRTVQEFWQRWHITLGIFLRNYVMYPLLRSRVWNSMGKRLKKRFGKAAAKKIPLFLAMLILWFCNGIWHGGAWKYIFGVGLWFWITIVIGQLLEPVSKKLVRLFSIPTESLGWHIFQSVRTYLLYAVGALFFCSEGLGSAIHMIRWGFTGPAAGSVSEFASGLSAFGLTMSDFLVTVIAVLIVFLVSCLTEKYGSIRDRIFAWHPACRYLLWLALLLAVLIFGKYGNGYDAASFIYAQF